MEKTLIPAKKPCYKTQICNKLFETGNCEYGLKCRFTHSNLELNVVFHDLSYKTELCNKFYSEQGICNYRRRCTFIHNSTQEMLKKEYDKLEFKLKLLQKIEEIKISEKDYINTIFD